MGVGGAVTLPASVYGSPKLGTFSSTLGLRSEQNPYFGELAAMARALSSLPMFRSSSIVLSTNNQMAVLTLRQPRQQSSQQHVRHIYNSVKELQESRNIVAIRWLPASEENQLLKIAKEKAREATQQSTTPQTQIPRARSTTLSMARSKRGMSGHL